MIYEEQAIMVSSVKFDILEESHDFHCRMDGASVVSCTSNVTDTRSEHNSASRFGLIRLLYY
jgi:hypothetical protein